jgi:hypothetical protein
VTEALRNSFKGINPSNQEKKSGNILDTNLDTCTDICRNISQRPTVQKLADTDKHTDNKKNIYINAYTNTENCRHSQTQAQISVADEGFRKKGRLHVRIKYLSHFGAKYGCFVKVNFKLFL